VGHEFDLPAEVQELLAKGTVLPAHPLALTERRTLDRRHQRALTRYYAAAGAGGVALGVHSTQFQIREPSVNLLQPVLELAAETIDQMALKRPFIKVAGIVGPTEQAISEAELAKSLGYHLGLVSMGGLSDFDETALIERMRRISEVIPVFGFYLQPAVGGRVLSRRVWEEIAEIPGLLAIKIAPFDRYRTLDVVRAVAESSRCSQIALYTGNDDNIVVDLLTPYRFWIDGQVVEKRIVGGLLGHWAVWTKRAVEMFERIKEIRGQENIPQNLLTEAAEITAMNAILFDAEHDFQGSIAGIHEILYRQGLLAGTWCLDPGDRLSPGQMEDIVGMMEQFESYHDDVFVAKHLASWLDDG